MRMDTFYILVFLHLAFLVIGFGSVVVIDAFGLAWLLKLFGVDLNLVRRVASVTQRLIWLGYAGMLATGIPMLVIKGHLDNLMYIKLFLVGMVGLNGVFLHFIKKGLDSLGEDIQQVPPKYYFRIGLASAVSQTGWWGAMFIGYYHRQVSPYASWPQDPWIIIGGIILLIGTVALIGERLTSNKS
jgi:hypothetical protein